MAHLTVLIPCYNEEGNIAPLVEALNKSLGPVSRHTFSYLFIDNASTDGTQRILREMAAREPRVQVIFNARNFGQVRSPFHGLLQTRGDAAILMAADFQDPPELLPQFIAEWEKGVPLVLAIKNNSQETPAMYAIRTFYYRLLNQLSEAPLNENSTGFGLYDRKVLESLRGIPDPNPYLRGLVCELGFASTKVFFTQPRRLRGFTKNNFYRLYDIAMIGFVTHSKIPLRLATMSGFFFALVSLLVSLAYFVVKLVFWNEFKLGMAPTLIGIFFLGAVQLICIGILGEYIGSIHTKVSQYPLVVERERINL